MKKQLRHKLDLQTFAAPTRLSEIETRKAEIRGLLEGDGEVDLNELETELRSLEEEASNIEKRKQIAAGINTGAVEARKLDSLKPPEKEVRSMKWDEAIGTTEYRDVWAKDMMGITLEAEERSMYDRVNVEYRDFTHTTENSAILIPKTVSDGIWKRAEEQYPLWADVRKLRVRGNLTMIKSDGNAVNAQWYDEATKVITDKLGFGELNLTGCELAKAVQVTWKLRKMAIEDFIAYITREIADRMGIALSAAVYAGKGKPSGTDTFKPEPRGIKTVLEAEVGTPQIVEYDTDIAYNTLTAAMGGIHSSYANGVTIYANNTTIWSHLATLVDAMGRPMFIADVMAGGVGRIFGRTIKADATIPDGEILLGNLNDGYLANINEDITMYTEDHVRERLTDYMGYAIVDGDVVDSKAFVIIADSTPTP
ncbi:phage major capsid protein [Virgibacillus sp. LDC1]|nr:phage major capsid protein [Virgibacillus sp. LDC1]